MRLESKCCITTFWVVPSKNFREQRNMWGAYYHLTESFGNPGWKVNGKVTFPGGAPHMKGVEMLVGNFELNP